MKRLFYTFVLTGLAVTASCSKGTDDGRELLPDAKAIVLKPEYETKTVENRSFAIDFFKTVVAESGGDNIFVSPYSVNTALNMLWNGAAGNTADEIALTLRNGEYTREQINDYSKSLTDALLSVDPTTDIRIANSIWADVRTPLKEAFASTNRTFYDAEMRNVDFKKQSTFDEIDKWGLEKTNNKIDKISESLTEDTIYALINAIYFKAKWKYEFKKSETADEIFNNGNGSEVRVRMMNLTEDFLYSDYGGEWRMLSMPYGNRAFSMVILMPSGDRTLDEMIPELTAEKYYALVNTLDTYEVRVKLPRFKAEYSYELHKKILPQMGMRDAFIPFVADLSDMSDVEDTFVGVVSHKTYIDVYEEGTEAAAVTVVGVDFTTALPGPPTRINYYADRPFIYSIIENSTGTILFMGRVNNF